MSYRPKQKVCCYSATIRSIDIILSYLICEVIMNLTSPPTFAITVSEE